MDAMKDKSSLQLSRDLGVQYKTAFMLAQKLRKTLLVHWGIKYNVRGRRYGRHLRVAFIGINSCATNYDIIGNSLDDRLLFLIGNKHLSGFCSTNIPIDLFFGFGVMYPSDNNATFIGVLVFF